MNYYYLFRPCIGPISGKQGLVYLFRKKLEGFISYTDLGDWFSLNGLELATPNKVDEVLDLKGNHEIKLILIKMSPYKRAFQYYLSYLKLHFNLDMYENHPDITPEKFTEFLLGNNLSEDQKINISEIYEKNIQIKIDFVIEYDNLIEDLRKIPGLEDTEDNFLLKNREIMKDYRNVYTDDARKWVEETYSKDLQVYGYTFST